MFSNTLATLAVVVAAMSSGTAADAQRYYARQSLSASGPQKPSFAWRDKTSAWSTTCGSASRTVYSECVTTAAMPVVVSDASCNGIAKPAARTETSEQTAGCPKRWSTCNMVMGYRETDFGYRYDLGSAKDLDGVKTVCETYGPSLRFCTFVYDSQYKSYTIEGYMTSKPYARDSTPTRGIGICSPIQ